MQKLNIQLVFYISITKNYINMSVDKEAIKAVLFDYINSIKFSILPLILVLTLVVVIYQSLHNVLFPDPAKLPVYLLAVSVSFEIILYLLMSLSYVYVFSKIYNYNYLHNGLFNTEKILDKKDAYFTLIGIVSLLVLNYISEYIITYFEFKKATNNIINIGQSTEPVFFLYMIPIMIIFVGFGEEILFRGIVQGGFRKYLSIKKSIVFASIIFSLLHIPAIDGSIYSRIPYVLITFTLSLILGYIYERTENIIVVSLIHGLYNSVLMLQNYALEASLI